MDWTVLYGWLEQKSGVSYDPNDDLNSLQGEIAFTEPFTWAMKINFIIEDMNNAIETIEEYSYELTDDMPSEDDLIKNIKEHVIDNNLVRIINSVKQKIGLSINPITDEEGVLENVNSLRDLIMTMNAFPLEELQKRKWFETYEEESENALSDILEIHKNDLIDIHQSIESLVEDASFIDEDDEDFEDMDMDMDDDE